MLSVTWFLLPPKGTRALAAQQSVEWTIERDRLQKLLFGGLLLRRRSLSSVERDLC